MIASVLKDGEAALTNKVALVESEQSADIARLPGRPASESRRRRISPPRAPANRAHGRRIRVRRHDDTEEAIDSFVREPFRPERAEPEARLRRIDLRWVGELVVLHQSPNRDRSPIHPTAHDEKRFGWQTRILEPIVAQHVGRKCGPEIRGAIAKAAGTSAGSSGLTAA